MDKSAEAWLRAAIRDYKTYDKEVSIPIFSFIKCLPKEPQNPAYHLAQCVEKLIKYIAIKSGYRSEEDLKRFSHNSLGFYSDLMIPILDNPFFELFFKNVEGKIFEQSTATIYNYSDAVRRLTDIKNKSRVGSIDKDIDKFAWEFATLSEDQINMIIDAQKKSLRIAKIGVFILHLIPTRLLIALNVQSDSLSKNILNVFQQKGFLLSSNIESFFQNKGIQNFLNKVSEETKIKIIVNSGHLLVFGCLLGSLLWLTALTYVHGVAPRYPGDNDNSISSESYNNTMGFSRAIINVGNLTSMVLREMKKYAEHFEDLKEVFSEVVKRMEDTELKIEESEMS